jgi:hypothetical protein
MAAHTPDSRAPRRALMHKLLIALMVVAVPAFAGGKDFRDGLSRDEVTKLTRSLGALEAKYHEARPSMEKLKKNPEVRKNAKLAQTASEVLQHYTAVGVFLHEMEQGIKKRDPKVNSFETKIQGEIDQWELKLAALEEQAKAAKAPSVAELVAGTIILAAALDTLWVTFDGYYDVAVADVDLVVVPVYDVYEVVHYTSPYVLVEDSDTAWEGGTDVADYYGEE